MMTGGNGKIGFFSCIALVVGASVGSAIFSLSGLTIFFAGASAIVSWILAAVLFSLYGMIVAELAVRYPHSGGIYIFPTRAIGGSTGAITGFFSAWGYIMSNIVAIGFSAMYIGRYFIAGISDILEIPIDEVICNGGYYSSLISALAVVAGCVLLLRGGKRSQIVQNTLVLILLATILVFCAAAFSGGRFHTGNFNHFFNGGAMGGTGFLSAVPIALVAYGGAIVVPFLASEIRNPLRNIPRSLVYGLFAVAAIYIALIVSILGILPLDVVKGNESLRLMPLFASIIEGYLSDCRWLVPIVALSGIIALITTVLMLLRVNSRAIQAMAAEACIPAAFYSENKAGVPYLSLIAMAAVTAFMCFSPEITSKLILMGAVMNVVSMTITSVSLIVSRKKYSSYKGYKAEFGTLLPFVVIAIFWLCYMPDIIGGSTDIWLFSAIVYAGGLLCLCLMRGRRRRMLGGVVVHGKGHGHLHGMPTANLEVHAGEKLPQQGVWAVNVFVDGHRYKGMTNVGLRPSDDDSPIPTVETFIIDFNKDIYGASMEIEFVKFIRETRTFANLDELKQQIDKDLISCGLSVH